MSRALRRCWYWVNSRSNSIQFWGVIAAAFNSLRRACIKALTNLKAVLGEAGATFDDVVKATVFLRDMGDFKAMNAVYAEFFTGELPARSCVAVAGLPVDARVEIEVIARVG